MISKELLSEVLGYEVNNLEVEKFPKQHGNILHFNTSSKGIIDEEDYINIYELAHKCKEWAVGKGYIIEVGVHPTIKKDRSDRDYFYKITTDRGQRLISKFVEIIKTEPEAIFKACELILKEMR